MSTTLYHGEPNGPSLSVLAVLFEKNVDAKLVRCDLARGARHQLPCAQQTEVAMSVEGEGPVLLVDGEALADSVFIACYLDDVGSGLALRPSDPYERWRVMCWCRQFIERTAPAAALLGCQAYPPAISPAALAQIVSVDLRERWRAIAEGRFDAAQLTDSRHKITQAVARIEAALDGRDWLFGMPTIADFESYAWLAGMVPLVPDAFAGQPRTMGWLERMHRRPATMSALALATSAHPTHSWAPGPEINRWG
jgi:GST-like protein